MWKRLISVFTVIGLVLRLLAPPAVTRFLGLTSAFTLLLACYLLSVSYPAGARGSHPSQPPLQPCLRPSAGCRFTSPPRRYGSALAAAAGRPGANANRA